MFATSLSDVGNLDLDIGHDHRECSLPLHLRDVSAIVRPAVGAIEVRCEDATPWAGIGHETHSWVSTLGEAQRFNIESFPLEPFRNTQAMVLSNDHENTFGGPQGC